MRQSQGVIQQAVTFEQERSLPIKRFLIIQKHYTIAIIS